MIAPGTLNDASMMSNPVFCNKPKMTRRSTNLSEATASLAAGSATQVLRRVLANVRADPEAALEKAFQAVEVVNDPPPAA